MRRYKKIIMWAVLGVLVSLLLTYAGLAITADRALVAARLAAQQAGYPTEPSDFAAQAVADADNAAPVYASIDKLLNAENWFEMDAFDADVNKLSPEDITQIQEFLQRDKVQRCLELFAEAGRRPFYQSGNVIMEYPNGIVEALNWGVPLFLDHAFHAYLKQDNYQQALLMLKFYSDYANHQKSLPLLMAHSARCHSYTTICKGIQLTCERSLEISDNVFDAVPTVTKTALVDALIKCIHSERVLTLKEVFTKQDNWEITVEGYDLEEGWLSLYRLKPFKDFDYAACIGCCVQVAEALQQPYQKQGLVLNPDTYSNLDAVLVNSFDTCQKLTLRACADIEITKAGLACLRYRQEHKLYPKTLEVVGTFIDPFTEKPLLYSSNAHGFEISSLGENLDNNDKKAPRWLYKQP